MSKIINTTWIIGSCDSEGDGVTLERVCGSVAQVKKHIANIVKDAKRNDNSFDYGTTAAKDIEYDELIGSMYGYAVFAGHHLDITAIPEPGAKIL